MADTSSVITRHRGDTKPIMFRLWEDKVNEVPLDITGYSFKFTVDLYKSPENTDNNVFTLDGAIVGAPTNGMVMFEPSALGMDLPPRIYYYDFQLIDSGGYIDTPALDKFIISQDITK